MLKQVPTASQNLSALITEENGPKAMMEFLHVFENGELLSVADSIGIQDVISDVKRQIGSGEASWLWDKDTGIEELKKLLVDYRIILRSSGFESVSKSTSFFSCMRAWKEYANFLKVPCSICKAKVPELSYFFECLRNIAEECDLSHDKRQRFLVELETKASIIVALRERKMDVFKEEYSLYLSGFSEKEITKLYSKLPNSSYTDDKATYEKNIGNVAETVRSEQERFKLLALWESLTQTATPYEWCDNASAVPATIMEDVGLSQCDFDSISSASADPPKSQQFSVELLSATEKVLSVNFVNGMRKNATIAKKKFKNAYLELTGEEFPESIDVDELVSAVGFEYADKFYAVSEADRQEIQKRITAAVEAGNRVMFYEEVYQHDLDFMTRAGIFSPDLLKAVLKQILPDMQYMRASFSPGDHNSLEQDVINCYGEELMRTYSEIKARLPYTDLYQIRLLCSRSSKFVWAREETYIFAHNLPVNSAYKKGNSRVGCLFCPMGGGKSDSFRYLCYPQKIDKYTSLIRDTIYDKNIESYITNGGWIERKNGRDIVGNASKYHEEIKEGNLIITVTNPNTDWCEWIKTLGVICLIVGRRGHHKM